MKELSMLVSGVVLLFSAIGLKAQDSIPTKGFAAFDESGVFNPYEFNHHAVGDDEIQVEILYSGISMRSFIGKADRRLFGSRIGSILETQEAINYSIENKIYPEVGIIPADAEKITEAYDKVRDGKVKFRYVIDMSTLK